MLRHLATCLLAVALGVPGLHARGGGGCLQQGTLIDTPAGPIPVEHLRAGDTVWGMVGGLRVPATVQTVYAVDPESYVELSAGAVTLRLTAEHPVQVAPGVFVRADRLPAHQRLARSDRSFAHEVPVALTSARVVRATEPAYNLLVSPGGVFFANGLAVHNKGCFLPDTPVTMADGSRRAISAVKTGDAVLAFDAEGAIVHARVDRVLTHEVTSYLVLRTAHIELRVTEEHPFYVGAGTFKTAEALHTGDRVFVYDGRALAPQPVLALERVPAKVTVYNLQTDAPHTFLANGVAVHNKGGGCFAAGTLVATPAGPRAIETLQLGDTVLAPGPAGTPVPAPVEGIYMNFSPLLVLHTDRGTLRTTEEHPLRSADGTFHSAAYFASGSQLGYVDGSARVLSMERAPANVAVYTLSVGAPHTFLADGFVAHNKGGGFGGGHYGGSGGGDDLPVWFYVVIIVGSIVYQIVVKNKKRGDDDGEELDYCFSRKEIDAKAVKTLELLHFISKTDPLWTPDSLRTRAREVFVELQACWEKRDYAPMKPLLMRDLYEEHCAQLRGLRQTHEINRLDNLSVDAVDIVQVNYTQQKEHRVFTALITAAARDYYIDDRTDAFLRGDDAPAQFQEFWTFQLCDGTWMLREIEQTKESDLLTTENLFEPFTDAGRDQIYGAAAGKSGPAGPALPADVQTKAQKIDRLLNFLVQTDRIWNRDEMLATARRVFTNVQLIWQDGRTEMLTGADIDDAFAAEMRAGLEANQRNRLKVELRNFCVRKLEIVLVNNRDDRRQDEFTARITAHAQTIVTRAGVEVRHDEYVKPWTDFWTFGRNAAGTGWSLRAIHPTAEGGALVARENTDEGSSAEMLEWYYSKTRAN
jgi:predicted lipid-binding transport protein (Tim44 family)